MPVTVSSVDIIHSYISVYVFLFLSYPLELQHNNKVLFQGLNGLWLKKIPHFIAVAHTNHRHHHHWACSTCQKVLEIAPNVAEHTIKTL